MLSATLDSSGSPKKRAFSRAVSEDESLRSFIKEAESSSRRLARSDSRAGTLKKRTESQTEQELFTGLPEMLELQASYEEAVAELRGLEVERDTLLFQVDVLQDSLEGVEELLAETQREAGQANAELEREREARRKLEGMVSSLMKEVERLKEERNNTLTDKGSQNDTIRPILPSAGDMEIVVEKIRKFVSMSPMRVPSLALDRPASEEGVLQRPCENGVDDEKTDSDSISAYEDAPSDTPDNDRLFPGEDATADLPHDSENTAEKQPEACVVS
ncbi:leucine-rich repeat flightless-interacting protein 1-like [Periophthalmus magnuspinnatus]|uniref:leucine-rich repeat flightless-interacting protein 1-like n=1 Tax=Periophthalmus magnuspinnatus TaxID=409849 RepID=UPI00145B5AC5|nr:leucine-rich repeat flightless-interacting protein 1-like [Periophthalmus magnuspinnatus]XP_033822467.1 leucine-rich repeat flightless-interacting protein 1-like [Periophthalmus magnuspinnatus]